MRAMVGVFAACIVAVTSTGAFACGRDLQLMEMVSKAGEAPLFRCGREFNEMLAHVSKHKWKEALASYRAHLGNAGKWYADKSETKAALAWLEQKAAAK